MKTVVLVSQVMREGDPNLVDLAPCGLYMQKAVLLPAHIKSMLMPVLDLGVKLKQLVEVGFAKTICGNLLNFCFTRFHAGVGAGPLD